jgi:hypothetical protein
MGMSRTGLVVLLSTSLASSLLLLCLLLLLLLFPHWTQRGASVFGSFQLHCHHLIGQAVQGGHPWSVLWTQWWIHSVAIDVLTWRAWVD